MLKSKKHNQPFNSFFLQKKNHPLLFCLVRIRGSFSYNNPIICRDRNVFKQSSAFLFFFSEEPAILYKRNLLSPILCKARDRRGLAILPMRQNRKKGGIKLPLCWSPKDSSSQGVIHPTRVGLKVIIGDIPRELLAVRRKKRNHLKKKSYAPLILNQPIPTLSCGGTRTARKVRVGALDGSSYPFFLPVRIGRKRSLSDSASYEKKATHPYGEAKKSRLKSFFLKGKTKEGSCCPSYGQEATKGGLPLLAVLPTDRKPLREDKPFPFYPPFLKKVENSFLSPLWGERNEGEESELEEGGNKKKSRFFKERNAYLIPDFVEIQRKSFFQLLENGLIEEFAKRNPITNKNLEIFFYPEYYQLTPPEYNPRRAILISKSYSAKLFIPAQLTDKKLKKSQLKWVLIGNLPLMTKRGHFVLNGAPRVIVNQILRSPGIYFQGSLKEIFSDQWSEKPEITYKRFYTDLICLRGTWLRIEIDKNKDIWAQMKKVPKIPLLWFLLAMGLTERIIFKSVINPTRLLANFNLEIKRKIDYEYVTNASDAWKAISNLISSSSKETSSYAVSVAPTSTFFKKGGDQAPTSTISKSLLSSPSHPMRNKQGEEGVTPFLAKQRQGLLLDRLQGEKKEIKTADFQDQNKQVLISINNWPSDSSEKDFRVKESDLLATPLLASEGKDSKETLISGISRRTGRKLVSFLNIVEHSKEGRNWIFKRFMNPRTYDLGSQGRLNFNRKLGLSISSHQTTLTAQDVLFATDYLFKVEKGLKNIDDIDHLKNRRVRTSGELLQIQIGIGLVRLEKIIREKFSKINAQTRASDFLTSRPNNPKSKALKLEALTPLLIKKIFPLSKGGKEVYAPIGTNSFKQSSYAKEEAPIEEFKMNNLINTKAFNGALREFFGSSQLSQFMDQLNPLAEITHKRRLSSMGPGGVTRDSATLAIRGIHPTHYGRICPIETPEGKNTGLVNSLTTYSRASSQGFLESPFYKVYKGQVQKNAGMFFFSAEQEENIKVAAADVATPSFSFFSSCSSSDGIEEPAIGAEISPSVVSVVGNKNTLLLAQEKQDRSWQLKRKKRKGQGRIGFLPKNKIPAKIAYGDTISKISRNIVEYIGVSPIQMISIATSLIPFVEHDDANRALMGSNMQRQAVPLVRAERPLVGTGLESRTVSDSGHAVMAKESGYVAYVSGKKMVIYTIPTNN